MATNTQKKHLIFYKSLENYLEDIGTMQSSKPFVKTCLWVNTIIQHGRKVSDSSLSGDKPRKNTHLARGGGGVALLSLYFVAINKDMPH